MKASFAEIKAKNIEHLIIDVRNNGGGDPIPTQELISYLIDEKFVMYKDVYTKTNKIKDRKYYKKQGVFLLNLFSWLKVKKISDNHYRRRNKEGMDVYSPKENIFKGQLYILTNGNSFSATIALEDAFMGIQSPFLDLTSRPDSSAPTNKVIRFISS